VCVCVLPLVSPPTGSRPASYSGVRID